jgi:hypothetical protein
MISRLESERFNYILIYVVSVKSLCSSGTSGLNQRSHSLVCRSHVFLVSPIEFLIREIFKVINILNFTNLPQFYRSIQVSFNPWDFLEFVLLSPDLIMLSPRLLGIIIFNFPSVLINWSRRRQVWFKLLFPGISLEFVLFIAVSGHQILGPTMNLIFRRVHPTGMVPGRDYIQYFIGGINCAVLLRKHLSFEERIGWIVKVPLLILHIYHYLLFLRIQAK